MRPVVGAVGEAHAPKLARAVRALRTSRARAAARRVILKAPRWWDDRDVAEGSASRPAREQVAPALARRRFTRAPSVLWCYRCLRWLPAIISTSDVRAELFRLTLQRRERFRISRHS